MGSDVRRQVEAPWRRADGVLRRFGSLSPAGYQLRTLPASRCTAGRQTRRRSLMDVDDRFGRRNRLIFSRQRFSFVRSSPVLLHRFSFFGVCLNLLIVAAVGCSGPKAPTLSGTAPVTGTV